jgi:hypothetical protein
MDSHKGRVTPGPTWEKTFIATSSGPRKIMNLNYSFLLFWGFPPPRALHIKPELFYFVFKEGTLQP